MSDALIQIVIGVLIILIPTALGALFFMWRDIALLKRDVDAVADIVGTERAKARRKKSE